MEKTKASNARERSALTQALAEHLRAEMGVARLSTRALAARAGITERTLARIVSGERTMDVTHLDRIAKAFGVSMAEFLGQAEARIPGSEAPPSEGTKASGG